MGDIHVFTDPSPSMPLHQDHGLLRSAVLPYAGQETREQYRIRLCPIAVFGERGDFFGPFGGEQTADTGKACFLWGPGITFDPGACIPPVSCQSFLKPLPIYPFRKKILAVPETPELLRPFAEGGSPSFPEFLQDPRGSCRVICRRSLPAGMHDAQDQAKILQQDLPGDLIDGIVMDCQKETQLAAVDK